MQIRDLIELLQQHDPYDQVEVEIQSHDYAGPHEFYGKIETVTRENSGSPYVVIKCRE
jgi:hypothetical protein